MASTVVGSSSSVSRLAKSLVSTSAAIGSSMFVGDLACQFIQYNGERTQLLAAHTQAVLLDPSLPLPDVDAVLASAPPSPTARVPVLPASLRAFMPRWWNSDRGLAMFATGFLAGGPWQWTIQRSAEHLFPGKALAQIGKKMAMNMGTAPIGISSTFYLTNFFQGGHHDAAVARIKRDVGSTFVTGFFYWPFVSFLNLRFVSLDYRPIVGSLAGAFWNIYISSKANGQIPAADLATSSVAPLSLATLPTVAATEKFEHRGDGANSH